MKPSSSELISAQQRREALDTKRFSSEKPLIPEAEEKPMYLRARGLELMQALKPIFDEVLASEKRTSDDGDFSKKEKLEALHLKLVNGKVGVGNLQFLIRNPSKGGVVNLESGTKAVMEVIEVSKADQQSHTDPILKLKDIGKDQFLYKGGSLEVNAAAFFREFFEALGMAGGLQEDEMSLLIERIGQKFSDQRLRINFREQDWVTKTGLSTTQVQLPFEIPPEEMPGVPRWKRIQGPWKEFFVTPLIESIEVVGM